MAKGLLAKLLASLTAAWVSFPPALLTLLAMMALDYISGLAAAGSKGKIDSTKAKRGIWKKIVELTAGIGGYVATMNLPPVTIGHTQIPVNIGSAICGAFILAELISILENVGKAGVRLPGRIVYLLGKLKGMDSPDSAAKS
jgi:toxin secretion/phage lysis holin